MSETAIKAPTQTFKVLREGVRAEGAVWHNPMITDRFNQTHTLPGTWRVKSCQRNDRFKHWLLSLEQVSG